MTPTLERVRSDALSLPEEARESLALDLVRSLHAAEEAERQIQSLADGEREELQATLLERDKGPFVEIDSNDDAYWNGIRERGLKKAAALRKQDG